MKWLKCFSEPAMLIFVLLGFAIVFCAHKSKMRGITRIKNYQNVCAPNAGEPFFDKCHCDMTRVIK